MGANRAALLLAVAILAAAAGQVQAQVPPPPGGPPPVPARTLVSPRGIQMVVTGRPTTVTLPAYKVDPPPVPLRLTWAEKVQMTQMGGGASVPAQPAPANTPFTLTAGAPTTTGGFLSAFLPFETGPYRLSWDGGAGRTSGKLTVYSGSGATSTQFLLHFSLHNDGGVQQFKVVSADGMEHFVNSAGADKTDSFTVLVTFSRPPASTATFVVVSPVPNTGKWTFYNVEITPM